MRIAVLGESGGDEEFVPVIAGAILDRPIETVSRHLRARGWPSVRQVLPAVFKELFYHSDADGLIVIADSDFSRIHRLSDEPIEASRDGCRACQLRLAVQIAQGHVRSTARRRRLGVAIGLAVPAIEAWYLCGVDGRVTEAAWVSGLNSGPMPYTRAGLKRAIYETDRPSLELERRRAREHAERLVSEGRVRQLVTDFPDGFGALINDLRSWVRDTGDNPGPQPEG